MSGLKDVFGDLCKALTRSSFFSKFPIPRISDRRLPRNKMIRESGEAKKKYFLLVKPLGLKHSFGADRLDNLSEHDCSQKALCYES